MALARHLQSRPGLLASTWSVIGCPTIDQSAYVSSARVRSHTGGSRAFAHAAVLPRRSAYADCWTVWGTMLIPTSLEHIATNCTRASSHRPTHLVRSALPHTQLAGVAPHALCGTKRTRHEEDKARTREAAARREGLAAGSHRQCAPAGTRATWRCGRPQCGKTHRGERHPTAEHYPAAVILITRLMLDP